MTAPEGSAEPLNDDEPLPDDEPRQPRSRRRLLVGGGLAVAVLVGLVGGGFWLTTQRGPVQIGPGGGAADPDALETFVACVREDHGIDLSDPTPDGTLTLPEGVDPTGQQWQLAWNDCGDHLPGRSVRFEAPGSDGERGVQR